jgi:RimJ/RimL family protein N-acetyltransferase
MITKPIKTTRLMLREIEDTDRDHLIDIFMDDTVKQTYMLPDFASREEAGRLFERIRELSKRDDRYVLGVSYQGILIGLINDVEILDKSIEVGYAFHPKYYNQGFATEALGAMIAYLFDKGFEEVIAGAFEENAASMRVMQKCGMKKIEKTDQIDYRNKTHLCIYYTISPL